MPAAGILAIRQKPKSLPAKRADHNLTGPQRPQPLANGPGHIEPKNSPEPLPDPAAPLIRQRRQRPPVQGPESALVQKAIAAKRVSRLAVLHAQAAKGQARPHHNDGVQAA
jgi:hypothetical protein